MLFAGVTLVLCSLPIALFFQVLDYVGGCRFGFLVCIAVCWFWIADLVSGRFCVWWMVRVDSCDSLIVILVVGSDGLRAVACYY